MSEKVMLIRGQDGAFYPASQHDDEILSRVATGGQIKGDPRQPRNPAFHRKTFAMLHEIYENLPDHMSLTWEQFYQYMKVAAGAVDQLINHKGEVYYVVKSLSYAEMDDLEFGEVYQRFIDVAVERLGMTWLLEAYA